MGDGMNDQDVVAVAASGYPPDVRPLFVSHHGDHAAVLLETGSGGHSYPYFVLCQRVDGRWLSKHSSNMPGWYQTEDDAGVVVFWDYIEGLAELVEIEFKHQRWPGQSKGGVVWAIWWDELDPSNYIEPEWPKLSSGQFG